MKNFGKIILKILTSILFLIAILSGIFIAVCGGAGRFGGGFADNFFALFNISTDGFFTLYTNFSLIIYILFFMTILAKIWTSKDNIIYLYILIPSLFMITSGINERMMRNNIFGYILWFSPILISLYFIFSFVKSKKSEDKLQKVENEKDLDI